MGNERAIPEGPVFSQAWRNADRDARRRVRRAVNRAQPADNPEEAALAVAVARGQQRFWRFGWLLGPVFAGLLLMREPLPFVLANVVFATILFGVLAAFFTRRSRRAEERNLEAARKSKPKRRGTATPRAAKSGTKKRTKKRRGKKRKR